MEKLEFETSKGRFRVVDEKDYIVFHLMIAENGFDCIELKEITEEQASEIVQDYNGYYNTYTKEERSNMTKSAIESLNSLLKSKGIHLFRNPYISKLNPLEYKQAEEKTFYNPYIFKL